MLLRIGIIGSSFSITKIKKAVASLKGNCEFSFMECNYIDDIIDTYEKHCTFFHAIIFSGILGIQEVMSEKYPDPKIPVYYIELPESDFYKKLFEIVKTNRNLDLSRIFIDFLNKTNNFYDLHTVLNAEEFPIICDDKRFDLQFNEIIELHISLWREKKIDLSITYIGTIADKLRQEGIPTVFLYPSEKSILQQIIARITDLQLFYLKDLQPCIGVISIDKSDRSKNLEMKKLLLHKELLEFTKNKSVFIIQENDIFEIIISYKDLSKITKNFTCSLLEENLQQKLNFKVNIGWGIGTDLHKVKQNAKNANKEVSVKFPGSSFIITDENKIIGPLGEAFCNSYSNISNTEMFEKSKVSGITNLQIQKVMSVLEKLHSNNLSSDDLAFYLGVTVRTANRILNKLEKQGIAKITYTKQDKLRGRPKKNYTIDYSNIKTV